jgi:endonuclease/exonuclease/phosphatase (EEP) superfamily protein YafD
VADIERAFAQVWAMTGELIPERELASRDALAQAGDTALRVVANIPATAGTFRLDQLVSALARKRLWLTDAYYAGTTAYVQALRAAAKDGVDVRLLVPNGTDVPLLRPLSRAGYRPLLEAGVRVFEWNGTMLHAKTAVADGRWAHVGSTNLNISSWLGNCEHLGTSYLERRHQARRLFDTRILRNGDLTGPRIILGDFNEWTRELASRLLSKHFDCVDARFYLGWPRTYPGVLPFLRLDHIYFDSSLTLEGATLYRSRKALIASDHLPIVADFHLANTSNHPTSPPPPGRATR